MSATELVSDTAWRPKQGRRPTPKTWMRSDVAVHVRSVARERLYPEPSRRLAQLLAEALREGLQLELLARDLAEQLVAIQAMALGPELPKHPARLSVGEPARPEAFAEVLAQL